MYLFKYLIAAGTFDHFHQGHQKFLETAFGAGEFVYCGLTDYQDHALLSDKRLPLLIQSFSQRLENLKEFLKANNYIKRTKIFSLADRFGLTLQKNNLEAIVVSKKTEEGGKLVNFKREKLYLKPLKIVRSETVKGDNKKPLSASSIRLGQNNSRGKSFIKLLPKKTLYLPSSQRHHFKKPIGALLKGSSNHLSWATLKASLSLKKSKTPFVITVGDITTHAFSLHKIPFNLAIIDQKTRRQKYFYLNKTLFSSVTRSVLVSDNPPGTITPFLISALQNIFSNLERNFLLKIKGEEDLTVLPCILLSPLNTLIFYGQPFEGIVRIRVTEKTKEKAVNLLKKFCF